MKKKRAEIRRDLRLIKKHQGNMQKRVAKGALLDAYLKNGISRSISESDYIKLREYLDLYVQPSTLEDLVLIDGMSLKQVEQFYENLERDIISLLNDASKNPLVKPKSNPFVLARLNYLKMERDNIQAHREQRNKKDE